MEEKTIKTDQEKLEILLSELNLNVSSFGRELGYKNRNSVMRIKNGESKLTSRVMIAKIRQRFPFVSLDFLLHGKFPVKISPEEQMIQNNLYEASIAELADTPEKLMAKIYDEVIALRKEVKELKIAMNK